MTPVSKERFLAFGVFEGIWSEGEEMENASLILKHAGQKSGCNRSFFFLNYIYTWRNNIWQLEQSADQKDRTDKF